MKRDKGIIREVWIKVISIQSALSLAVSTKELGCWLDGISPQGIQMLSKDKDGDMLRLTTHSGAGGGVAHLVKKRVVRFIEKYVSFLDGLVAPPTEVTMETIERYMGNYIICTYWYESVSLERRRAKL